MVLSFISVITNFLVSTIGSLGYTGIFILMAIESTIFPLPSELVLIPAGVLAHRGEMSILLIIISGALGSLAGALLCYWLAKRFGREYIERAIITKGKILFLNEHSIQKADNYFKEHGEITIFLSRLLPVVRHLISFPAGFANMNLIRFSAYTLIGATFWSIILVYFGYAFGSALAEQNMSLITILLVAFCIIIGLLYYLMKRKK